VAKPQRKSLGSTGVVIFSCILPILIGDLIDLPGIKQHEGDEEWERRSGYKYNVG
jgi:hypothetical protein